MGFNSGLKGLKQSSGSRTTLRAFLDRKNDREDPPTAQEKALSLQIFICLSDFMFL
jgi:hypothetical protein